MCRSDRAIGLNDVVLRPAQVGAGYRLQQIPGGHQVRGQVTMDLCGYRFRSESLRTGRVQVAYVGASSLPELSNEVVSYSPGGAAQALREVNAAVAACPHHAVASTVRGVPPLTYEITRLQDA